MARCESRRRAMSWAKAVSAVSEKDFWVLKFVSACCPCSCSAVPPAASDGDDGGPSSVIFLG